MATTQEFILHLPKDLIERVQRAAQERRETPDAIVAEALRFSLQPVRQEALQRLKSQIGQQQAQSEPEIRAHVEARLTSAEQERLSQLKEQVVQRVQERLRDCHPGGVNISVIESEVRLKDDYWYVPVQPSAQPPRTFEYYEVLADVETELSEHERLKVWLVPTLPDEPVPSPAASQ